MSEGFSRSWCPVCGKWVPSKFLWSDYDPVDKVVTRICAHCENVILGQPTTRETDGFDWDRCVSDPNFGKIRCPSCGTLRKPGVEVIEDPGTGKWRCISCNQEFWY